MRVQCVCVQVTDYILSKLNGLKYSKDSVHVGQIKFERGQGLSSFQLDDPIVCSQALHVQCT